MVNHKRYLNHDEINDILNGLPRTVGSNDFSVEIAQNDIKQNLFLQLREQKIVDHPEAIARVKTICYDYFRRAIEVPGTPVGEHTAEALGSQVTQNALNSFHHSGTSKGAVTGLDQSQELLKAPKRDRKFQVNRTRFKNQYMTFEEILELEQMFIEINVETLVRYKENNESIMRLRRTEDTQQKMYHDLYSEINDFSITPEAFPLYLEIELDLTKLFQYEVTTSEIAEAIEKNKMCRVVPLPTHMGIIHVFPDYEAIVREVVNGYDQNNEDLIKSFIQNTFIPRLKTVLIKGMVGNKSFAPYKVSPLDIKRSITRFRFDTELADNLIEFRFYKSKMRENGLSIERIYNFFVYLGYKVLWSPNRDTNSNDPELVNKVKIEVEKLPFKDQVFVLEGPNFDIASHVESLAEREMNDEEREDFERNTLFYFADVEGNNFINIISNPLVDPNRTISNNPHQMAKILGIGVVRQLLIEQYTALFSENVNSRYILNLVNFQTSCGTWLPVTSKGVSRQSNGPLTKASFQEATKCFVEGAAFGTKEKANTVPSCVYTGKRIELGTGSVRLENIPGFNARAYTQQEIKNINQEYIQNDDLDEDVFEDAEKDIGRFGMPGNYPPPPLVRCNRDLPSCIMNLIPVDIYTEIRSILFNPQTNYDPLEWVNFNQYN